MLLPVFRPEVEVVERFPHRVVDVEHVFVPMRDGVLLAARLWLPAGAEAAPVPAILEAIPYRKRDGTRLRDEPMHRWFAGYGYACARVDVRGSGDSQGVLTDEYTETEQQDAEDVIAWLAAQPWCDGRVGMIGKSWGGFGALQVAARRPAALRCVIAVCASDDRYADDAHYMGGCLLNENLIWGSLLMALCAQPPDPELCGDGWRERWHERLAAIAPFPAVWLRHPTRDDYWRHGSICEDFAAVDVPVWAISGWADGYSNAVLRLLAGLSCPRFGLIGPWGHVYPHDGVPGPAIGFLQEAVRFWDRFLRGVANGFDEEPRLRTWLQDSARPVAGWPDRSGRWIAEREWPSARIAPRRFAFGVGALTEGSAGVAQLDAAPLTHRSPQPVGEGAGAWCGFGHEGEHPTDQRRDDALSLCFDSAPLADELPVLGAPELSLTVAVDRPAAFVCARLCEVFPDGASARVSFGLLNLAHRTSHAAPLPMPPGEPQRITLRLNDVAHVFAKGSRVRVALSTSYWPMVWPAPAPVALTVWSGRSELVLPERPPSPDDDALRPFAQPRAAPKPRFTDVDEGGIRRRRAVDAATGELTIETELDLEPDGMPSRTRYDDIDVETAHGMRETFRVRLDDPRSARGEVLHRTTWQRGQLATFVELRCSLSADAQSFRFDAELFAAEGDREVLRRQWREVVPRRLL